MLNLWTGFTCVPVENDCGLYLEHLHENICSGDREHSNYLLNWMAYAVQQPGKAGEVAVVLRGKEGVGKGALVKWFGKLFGSHYRHIVHAKHLTGHFNSHLQQCSVLYADKSFFAGNRSHESVLKALITEETLMIEPKGVDPFFARNCIHLLMSSNNDWVVPAGADARRYFVLNASDARMQQSDYFAAITEQMETGGLQGLLHLLVSRDLSGFNVRQVPQTDALAEQKAYSRRGIDRLVEKIAHEGMVPCADATMPNTAITTGEEKGEGFYCAAKTLVPDLKLQLLNHHQDQAMQGMGLRRLEVWLPTRHQVSLARRTACTLRRPPWSPGVARGRRLGRRVMSSDLPQPKSPRAPNPPDRPIGARAKLLKTTTLGSLGSLGSLFLDIAQYWATRPRWRS